MPVWIVSCYRNCLFGIYPKGDSSEAGFPIPNLCVFFVDSCPLDRLYPLNRLHYSIIFEIYFCKMPSNCLIYILNGNATAIKFLVSLCAQHM
jgi:hypothetical protein